MFRVIYNRQHHWKILDQIRRKNYIKFEVKRKLLQSASGTNSLSVATRYLACYKKSSIPRSSSLTRVVNRCVYTGRKYSTLHKFQMSRFVLRVKAYEGLIPGLRRSSW